MKFKKALLRKRRKKESFFKYIMGLLHLWLGLVASIVVIIVCLTGSIYAFKTQISELYNKEKTYVKPQQEKLSLNKIQENLEENGAVINSIVIPKEDNRSLLISFTDKNNNLVQTHYFNPYTGEDLGAGSVYLDDFFALVLEIHKNLTIGEAGKQIVGVFVLIFIFLLLSGLVLWWPKRKKREIKNAFTIKWKAKFRRINYDLHNTLGFYSLILLLFIAITGVYITYPWVKTAVLVSLGGKSVQEQVQISENDEESDSFALLMKEMLEKENEKTNLNQEKTLPLDSIISLTNQHLPYQATTIVSFPDEKEPRYRIQKINTQNWLGAMFPDFIDFDKKGILKRKELFKDKPLHQQFKEISKPLHTGEIMGVTGISIYFLVTLIGCSLPITGFIIWWKRLK